MHQNKEDILCFKNQNMDRTKLMMLALMNDRMSHHKDAIMDSITKLDLNSLDKMEFDELLENTSGHGGISIDGKCSTCLDFLYKEANGELFM